MEKVKTTNVLDVWAKEHPVVMLWLKRIQKKRHAAFDLYRFCEWAERTPEDLLKVKDNMNSKEGELLLDNFIMKSPFTDSATRRIAVNVKSFFKAHYKELSKASGLVEYEKVKPYHELSKESLRKVYRRGCFNPRDRALLTFVFSTGVARETLVNLKWSHLEEGWEDKETPHLSIEDKLLKGHGVGKYKGVRQETFLTSEAKRDLLEYHDWIQARMGSLLTSDMNIFLGTQKPYEPLGYSAISKIFMELITASGVPISCHDGRRWVETAIEAVGIHPNWARKIRGRKIRGEEAPYSQPKIEQLREKYREAIPLLEFTVEAPKLDPYAMFKAEIKTRLRALPPSQRESFLKEVLEKEVSESFKVVAWSIVKADDEIKILLKEATKIKEESSNCQFVVSESDLAEYLAKGYKIVTSLASGKVVVEKT